MDDRLQAQCDDLVLGLLHFVELLSQGLQLLFRRRQSFLALIQILFELLPHSEEIRESRPRADPLLKLRLVDVATADGDDDVAGAAEIGQAVEHGGGGDGS